MPDISKHNPINSLVRSDLSSFIKKSFTTVNPTADYLHNWHIDLIAEYLKACESGDIKRLIINIPPRYMKSISVTVGWPAWLLGHDPSRRIIAASYAQKLSEKHSLDSRLVMQSPWYKKAFPNTKIINGQNEKSKFVTTKQGHRLATSVGGTITGEGGNFLIVDDPHKPNEVLSDAYRYEVLHWFDQTFSSRLDNKKQGVIVVVMQRLHEEDLSGHLLAKGGWQHLKLPAEAEEKQYFSIGNLTIKRDVGDALHKEREDKQLLEQVKKELGSYAYAAQYQQNPVPASGGMIKLAWFGQYENVPEDGQIIQSWDTAIKTGSTNDYSVCTTWKKSEDGQFYLLDIVQDRMEYPQLKRTILNQAAKWNPNAVLLEDKASGQSLLQDLRKENLPLIAIMPTVDKLTRVAAISALIEAGKVHLPKEAYWLAEFKNEVAKFPKYSHDDMVDSMSQFLNWIRKSEGKRPSLKIL